MSAPPAGVPTAIPAFTTTPTTSIPSIVTSVRTAYRTLKTRNVDFRITQLRKLYWAVEDYTPLLTAALKKDLGMSAFEAHLSEFNMVRGLILNMLKNIHNYTADEKVPDLPLTASPLSVRIRKEPLGVTLIISPYNFPVQLSIAPAIGAIAAGCAFVIKPSEASPATAAVLAHMVATRLDSSVYTVVNGAREISEALLEEKWDKIFYTGGGVVARIVSKKAAENLTPVSLELGGINPAFITPSADVRLAARRLMWGKVLNCGQVCMSQNYALVDRDHVTGFINALQDEYTRMFPDGAEASPDYSRIINQLHFDRITGYLRDTKGTVVMGGKTNATTRFIEPTVVLLDDEQDVLIQNETFGPVWSIFPVESTDQAIEIANRVCPTPLGVYPFGNQAECEKILSRITSGGASVNDSYMHGSIDPIPFGGVGESGHGATHGRPGFDAFTHRRSVVINPGWCDPLLRVRYMPYDWAAMKQLHWMTPKPTFDREARDIKGVGYWLKFVVTLGGKSTLGVLSRWVGVAAMVMSAGNKDKMTAFMAKYMKK